MQRLADRGVVAVFGIGDHGRQRHAGRPRPADQRQGQAPLFLKPDGRRDLSRRAPGAVGRPRLRQIQQRAHRPRPLPRPERGGDGHLAIGHLAEGAAVLPRHADRMRAGFGEARFVEDQNPRARRDHAPQTPPDRLGIPRRMRDEVLERLVRRRLADPLEHRRHRLARAVAEQPLDILPQRHVLRAMAKAVLELIEPPGQSPQQRPRGLVEHCASAYRNPAKSTMSSIVITRQIPERFR